MDVMQWLLETENPSVRYRTLVDLLDMGGTPEAAAARASIPGFAPVKKLLDAMHPDGCWLQKNPSSGMFLGEGVDYGSFGTTHFCLSYCAEAGLDREHPSVAKAAERYLGLQKEDGDWLRHFSCLYAYNVRTYVMLGYRADPRVRKVMDLMLGTARADGGYLCEMHEKPSRMSPKSCIRGSVKALLAFSELPEYWHHGRCLQLVDYFLDRNGIFRRQDHARLVNDDMKRNAFPVVWRTNVWEVLYALARMGYGKEERLADAWQVLDSRKLPDGRQPLDWTPPQSPWKIGKVGEPNKWITFYAMLAAKHAGRPG